MENLIDDLGGPTKVAAMAGVSVPTVCGWKKIPERRCVMIERANGGSVTVEQMRTDVGWVRISDPSWPHPAGRPCIDPSNDPAASPVPDISAGESAAIGQIAQKEAA